MSYVPSTTASFILTSLQPSSTTVYYTLQVIGSSNAVSSSFTSSVQLSMMTSLPTSGNSNVYNNYI